MDEPKGEKTKREYEVSGVVITGGTSGIGAAFITTILQYTPSVEIFNLSRSKPQEKTIKHFPCDLADPVSVAQVLPGLMEALQRVDGPLILINNSGFGKYGAFPEPDWQLLRDMIQVNVIAPLELTAKLLPLLQKKGGGVINVASTAAFQPTPFFSVYGATKAFLLNWSLSLYREYRYSGLHVLTVCPGPTATNFFRTAGFSERVDTPGKGLTAEQVAEQSWRAWFRRKPLVVNGFMNRVVALIAGGLPRTWSASLSERVMRHFRLDRLNK